MSDAAEGASPGESATYPEQLGPEIGAGERRRRWLRVLAVSGSIVTVALGAAWLTRERIADNVIAGQLKDLGLPGTYRIDSVGPRQQIISNVVIGDPAHPDLTIEQAVIEIEPRLGYPTIGRVMLVRPRLHGTVSGGKLSFGSLDKALHGDGSAPFRLPDMELAIVDGRARIDGEPGAIDLRLAGEGALRDGFAGTLAAEAPRLALGACRAEGASLAARITVADERPRLAGPLQLARLACGDGIVRRLVLDLDGTAEKALDRVAGRVGVSSGALAHGSARASGLNGTVEAALGGGVLTARYDLLGRGIATSAVEASTLGAKGTLRLRDGLARGEIDATLDGGGLRPGRGTVASFASLEAAGKDSLLAPVMGRIRSALLREGRGSRFVADAVVRLGRAGQINLVIPQGQLIGGSGQTLLALSRLQYAAGGQGTAPRLAGNFSTGGRDLPRITGRMDKGRHGDTLVSLNMAEYRAGPARIAVPQLVVAQTANGALGFSGRAIASGPLPGGRAENLVVPIEGSRTAGGAIALWRRCATVRFDALAYADLTLERRSLLLCPQPGAAIVRSDGRGTRVAFGTSSLDLAGQLGGSEIRIASGPVGFAMPGALYAQAVEVSLGPAETASRFRLADLKARIGQEIAGTFAGTDVRLGAVPLDLVDAAGRWSLAGGRLTLTDGAFRLEDRAEVDRFQPLLARGASLVLADSRIEAAAALRELKSDREVLQVAVEHELASGRGHADLRMDNLVFDRELQPGMLSSQLVGVVANAAGTIRGRGAIDWSSRGVTSSGRFGTDSLDFAAAFGPARGVSGTVEFSDLVNFVTPPGQRLKIASINPGIEVNDGEILFHLMPRSRLAIEGGSWPFLGGRLRLQPVDLNLGVAETRRYVLDIEGLDAARFVLQMELANLSATGAFDGTLPLVFDENGGRIEGGVLTSRPPGGNVSYVGALTWKDLSPIANFAFDALKSLDYRQMRIAMDGALEGDIVTRVRFDGVKQGAGAKRNLLTRQFARLPLQFNVNVRAPFYQILTSFKSMYDPAYVRDPRTLGLLDAQGRPVRRQPVQERSVDIQPPVSERRP